MRLKVTLTPEHGRPVTETLTAEDVALMFPIFAHEIEMAIRLGQPININATMNNITVTIQPIIYNDNTGNRETRGSSDSVESLNEAIKRRVVHRFNE